MKLFRFNLEQAQAESSNKGFTVRIDGIRVVTFSLVLALILVNASFQTQLNADRVYQAQQNSLFGRSTTPSRGLFYDRNGKKLVVNENGYHLQINKQELSEEELEKLLSLLKTTLKIPKGELIKKLDQEGENVILAEGLTVEQAVIIQTETSDMPVEVIASPNRRYLYPKQFAQILGYTGIVDEVEVESGEYSMQDRIGKYRLEKVLEDELKGIKGREVHHSGTVEVVDSVPGNNVILTVDAKWQRKLYTILGKQVAAVGANSGAAVIVDIDSGDLWAYASYPSYNPNEFVKGISSEDYQAYLDNPKKPLVDKVIGLQAPPGSSFKLVSSFVGLETGVIDESTRYYSTGCIYLGDYEFCEYGRYHLGELDLIRALTRSSNIFFCNSLLKLSKKGDFGKYYELGSQLGFGTYTGIGLEGETSGFLPSPKYKAAQYNENWYPGDTCNTVIGQGMVSVTPLQMAMMVATISNGGTYYKPNFIKEVRDQYGQLVSDDFNEVLREVSMKKKTQKLILEGMKNVAHNPEGTAYWYLHFVPGNFRAKTGSAEAIKVVKGERKSLVHGWVVGTFKYKKKTFAFAVHLHYGGGGWNSTPVIQRFVNCVYKNFKDNCEQI